jgi:hypothetical protein
MLIVCLSKIALVIPGLALFQAILEGTLGGGVRHFGGSSTTCLITFIIKYLANQLSFG